MISAVSLRSMQQARYSEESLGHFGLAARYYTHFTSPIRRYPDLIVHRLLRETFATGSIPEARQEKLRGLLPDIAKHSSLRERVAVDAERETTEMKEIEYMTRFIGETFPGIISGVTAFGIFVELENGVEGLVHVSRMANDYYYYVEEEYALVGERTKTAYRLGDEVEVVLIRASVEERNIDFILKDNGVYNPAEESKDREKPKKPEKSEEPAAKKRGAKKKDREDSAEKRPEKKAKKKSAASLRIKPSKKPSKGALLPAKKTPKKR